MQTQWLQTTQKMMYRKMLKQKILVVGEFGIDTWLDWQKRSLREAATLAKRTTSAIGQSLHSCREAWAAHVGRFGTDGRLAHFLKGLVMWRNLSWWRHQQWCNDIQRSNCFKACSESRTTPKVGIQSASGLDSKIRYNSMSVFLL